MHTRGRGRLLVLALLLGTAAGLVSSAAFQAVAVVSPAEAAAGWIATLDTDQRARGKLPFADATHTDWHFVPKPARKGVQLRDMTPAQQEPAHAK